MIINNIKNIIFDLDGTLIESSAGILEGFDFALRKHFIKSSIELNESLIGPPLHQTIAKLINSSDEVLINKVADSFKLFYVSEGYKKTILYEGINNLLDELLKLEKKIYIGTNKRLNPSVKIIKHLKIDKYFHKIYALDSFTPPCLNKSELIKKILIMENLETSNSIYIGDRIEDGNSADKNNLKFALAVWGFDPHNQLKLNPDWELLKSPQSLTTAH
jgi:phosphoglycolate phosphatase